MVRAPVKASAAYQPDAMMIVLHVSHDAGFSRYDFTRQEAEALQASLDRAIDAAKARPGTIPERGK